VHAIIKTTNIFCFVILQKVDANAMEDFFGLSSDIQKNSETGYILFYQSRE
jgi:ubiquitin carboxyl-terminal hydrolase 12/46